MPVSISVPTLVIELVIFLATVWLMERLVFAPIRQAWAEREQRIQEGLGASSHGQEEAQRAQAEVQRILTEARRDAQAEIDRATVAGGKIRDQLVAEATEEFRRLVEQARTEIAAQREQAASSLSSRIVDMALLAASRVTDQPFDQPQVRELAAAVVQRQGLN